MYTVHFLYILLLSINITLQEAYGCKQLRDVCFTAYLVFQVAGGGVYCTPSRLITGCHCSLWLARVITLPHAYRQVYPPEVYTKNYTHRSNFFVVFCCGLGLQGFHCAANCTDNILGHFTIAIQIQIPSVDAATCSIKKWFFRIASLALGQSYDCPSASRAILKNMGKYFTKIHQDL